MENFTYADCPTCHSSEAVHASGFIKDVTVFSRHLTGAGHITTCKACNTTFVAPTVRFIRTRRGPVSSRGCDASCLFGKTSCNCRCKGRCHGAGNCYCGK